MTTVDRLEGEWAVLCFADETTRTVKRCELPPNVQAGDVLVETAQGFCIDTAATKELRAYARRLRREL